jgi:hypothetical protein
MRMVWPKPLMPNINFNWNLKHLMQSLGSALVSKFDFIDFSFHENDMLLN